MALLGTVASAEASPSVDKADRHGDVKVTGSTDGVDPAIVDSVDLRHLTVTRQGHDVRVVVRLKQVLPPGRWFQLLGLTVLPPGWVGGPGWFFAVSATPQHLGSSMAFYADGLGEGMEQGDEPLFCHVAASKGAKVVRFVIPQRCLPQDAGQLTVSSVLLDKRGDNPLTAEDYLVVGGLVDLQP